MNSKVLEIRDRGTVYPILVTKLVGEEKREDLLLNRAGYNNNYPRYLVTDLENNITNSDPFKWTSGRTLNEAHLYITKEFDRLNTGDLIDIEYILGETRSKKESIY